MQLQAANNHVMDRCNRFTQACSSRNHQRSSRCSCKLQTIIEVCDGQVQWVHAALSIQKPSETHWAHIPCLTLSQQQPWKEHPCNKAGNRPKGQGLTPRQGQVLTSWPERTSEALDTTNGQGIIEGYTDHNTAGLPALSLTSAMSALIKSLSSDTAGGLGWPRG